MMPSERAVDKSGLPKLMEVLDRKSESLRQILFDKPPEGLIEKMRLVNAYHSNLIEGYEITPSESRRALAGDYDGDPERKDLQRLTIAHIQTQQWLDGQAFDPGHIVTSAFLKDVHARLYQELPDSMRKIGGGEGALSVPPGEFRAPGEEIFVGTHRPPESERLSEFMERFAEAYDPEKNRGRKRIIACMAAHHRLTWIHPFLDGNGRVCRLFTDTYLKHSGLGACGIWCLSRGLAKQSVRYKSLLAAADQQRWGDQDGRGGLSESALIQFCEFMMEVAIGEIDSMSDILTHATDRVDEIELMNDF